MQVNKQKQKFLSPLENDDNVCNDMSINQFVFAASYRTEYDDDRFWLNYSFRLIGNQVDWLIVRDVKQKTWGSVAKKKT